MKLCNEPGCERPRFAKKKCRLHYSRLMRGKPMGPPKYASSLTRAQIDYIRSADESLASIARKIGKSREFIRQVRNGRKLNTSS